MATTLNTPNQTTSVVDEPTKPWKALVPVVLGVLYAVWQAVQAAYSDNEWTQQDTITVVGAAIAALLVYLVPNPKAVERGNSL